MPKLSEILVTLVIVAVGVALIFRIGTLRSVIVGS
jgi:hypothetical protein